MFKKNTIFLVILTFLSTSCAGTWDSVKRGLTGQKQKSSDEFLVRKKDPLILPPDFENLPSPEERIMTMEEISRFEKTLIKTPSTESISSGTSSLQEAILQQIRKK